MEKVILLIILALIFTSCYKAPEITVVNQDVSIESDDKIIEEFEDREVFGISSLEDYGIELVMLKGSHIIDNSVGVTEYTGEYWQGKCVLELSRDNEIIDSIDINDIFGGILTFKDRFSIEAFQEDGITYFLIGQYFSSNIYDYRLFMVSDQKINFCKDVGAISISGKSKYSCLLDQDGEGRYEYQYYDNSSGKYVERVLLFEGGIVRRDI